MAERSKIEWTDTTWTPSRVRVRQNAKQIAEEKGYACQLLDGREWNEFPEVSNA